MCDTTERPEAVEIGMIRLVGMDSDAIIDNAYTLLANRAYYDAMAKPLNSHVEGKGCGLLSNEGAAPIHERHEFA